MGRFDWIPRHLARRTSTGHVNVTTLSGNRSFSSSSASHKPQDLSLFEVMKLYITRGVYTTVKSQCERRPKFAERFIKFMNSSQNVKLRLLDISRGKDPTNYACYVSLHHASQDFAKTYTTTFLGLGLLGVGIACYPFLSTEDTRRLNALVSATEAHKRDLQQIRDVSELHKQHISNMKKRANEEKMELKKMKMDEEKKP